jgi:ribosomal protein S18 acetylase RimI-like enzyme
MTSILVGPLPSPAWPDGVALRRFAEDDAREIHALLLLSYANGFGAVPPLDQWWRAVTTDEEFDPSLVVVAVHGTRIIGFALVWNSAFIKDIVVHPDWRRRGLASAMLAEISARLHARGFPSVALKVSPGNAGARQVYSRAGFREDG